MRRLLAADPQRRRAAAELRLRHVLASAAAHVPFYRRSVRLSAAEQAHYDGLIVLRNAFLARMNIQLGSIDGWKSFVMQSGTPEGRRAMLAHREARTRLRHRG